MKSTVNVFNIEEKLLSEINRAEFRGEDFLDCVDVNLLRVAYLVIKENRSIMSVQMEDEVNKECQEVTLSYYDSYVRSKFGNCHLKGCEMLSAACLAYDRGEKSISNIYIDLGKLFNCPSDRVERNIRHYIDITMKRPGLQPFSTKLNNYTNKEVVSAIVQELIVLKG